MIVKGGQILFPLSRICCLIIKLKLIEIQLFAKDIVKCQREKFSNSFPIR